jgi:TatA/E family protein of Tat protein translocase
MFGSLGGPELLLILLLALLVFGPRKLPEIGRTVGRSLAEFRRASTEFKMNLQREVEVDQARGARDDLVGAGREIAGEATDAARLAVARESGVDGPTPEAPPAGPPAGPPGGASVDGAGPRHD